jgi:hypothetical protein
MLKVLHFLIKFAKFLDCSLYENTHEGIPWRIYLQGSAFQELLVLHFLTEYAKSLALLVGVSWFSFEWGFSTLCIILTFSSNAK